MREWGHLRWGLFDESGSSDESPTKLFYHGMDGSLHPTRCSAKIVGQPRDAVTGGMCEIGLQTDLPSDTCMFMPDKKQPAGVEGSIMFMHSLPQVLCMTIFGLRFLQRIFFVAVLDIAIFYVQYHNFEKFGRLVFFSMAN